MRLFLLFLILFPLQIHAQNIPVADSLKSDTSAKSLTAKVSAVTDTAAKIDSSISDTTGETNRNTSISKLPPVPVKPKADTTIDSSFFDGIYFGAGIGWSLGSFAPAEMWKHTLPSVLKDLNLTESSFQIAADTTQTDSLLKAGDSSHVRFLIKDKLSSYNMSFPIMLSLTKFNNNYRHSVYATFYFFSKNQKSSVYLLNDSLHRRIDLKQKFTLYSASLYYIIARRIPPLYISIDGVDRTDLILGLGISPLMRIQTVNSIKNYAEETDIRMQNIEDTIRTKFTDTECSGLSMSMKAGFSTVKHLSHGALEASILYTLSWNNYFYHDGDRITNGDFNPLDGEADKKLSFLSNRLELCFSFLKKASK